MRGDKIMTVEEIRANRIIEAERIKNMTNEEILAERRENIKPILERLEKMKKENVKTK